MAGEDTPALTNECVVLGGRGLIGRSLVARLLRLGSWIVRVADFTPSIQLDADESLLSEALGSGLASYILVDVRNKDQIVSAIRGATVVFYTDTTDSCSHDFYFHYTMIVQGAKNVINACKECKVKQLIYNSPAEIVFESGRDVDKGDESMPYIGKFGSIVTDFQAQAEGLILRANDIDGLLTCAIRSSNVFGPGDKQLVPLMAQMAKSCWAKFIIGSEQKEIEFTYVENVAHANICAGDALRSRAVSVSGKAFFVTNLEQLSFWEFYSSMLDGLGYQRPNIFLPSIVVKFIILAEKLMPLSLDLTSLRKVFDLTSCTRTLNCSAAKKHIGYSPVLSLREGIALTTESFSQLAEASVLTSYREFDEESKANKVLGSGEVAEILLWRDERKSFTYFLSLYLFYFWFFLFGGTFLSSAAVLLLLAAVLLSLNRFLPTNVLGVSVPRIPSSTFEISEASMRNTFSAIGYLWNEGFHLIDSFAHGEDWHTFLMIVAFLYSFKLAASHSLSLAVGSALVIAFNAFFIYEQYEEEIDWGVASLLNQAGRSWSWLLVNLPSYIASVIPDHWISSQKQSYSEKTQSDSSNVFIRPVVDGEGIH